MRIKFNNPVSKTQCVIDAKEIAVVIALNKHIVITNSIPTSVLLYACPALENPEVRDGITKFEVKKDYGIIVSDSDKTL